MSLEKRFRQYVNENSLYGTHGYPALDFRCRQLFSCVGDLDGKTLLEIGGGEGLFSIWALTRGASKVVILEPEADGCTEGVKEKFFKHKRALGIPDEKIIFNSVTFQEYKAKEDFFDIVLSYKSINHLNETACANMTKSEDSWLIYKSYFERVYKLLRPGGYFIISDAGRVNFWNVLGLKSPFSPTIEWEKHQEPKVWKRMATSTGFDFCALTYHKFFPLRGMGILCSNSLVAKATTSQFVLTVSKKRN